MTCVSRMTRFDNMVLQHYLCPYIQLNICCQPHQQPGNRGENYKNKCLSYHKIETKPIQTRSNWNLVLLFLSIPFTSPFRLVYINMIPSKILNFTNDGWGKSGNCINLDRTNNSTLHTRFHYLVKTQK